MDFLRHGSGVRWWLWAEVGSLAHQRGAREPSAIGTPSAGLSRVGLRPRRARLRFTRRRESNDQAFVEQEQRSEAGVAGLLQLVNP